MQTPFDIFVLGTFGSLLAGLATGLGALGVFLIRRLNPRIEDGMLSAAAGVMLAATFFSLLLPALDRADALVDSKLLAVSMVGAGLLIGAAGLFFVHHLVPHEHFLIGKEGPDSKRLERIWCSSSHHTANFPKAWRWAWGLPMATGQWHFVAMGIGLQNIPKASRSPSR